MLIHVSVGAPFRAESSFLRLSECRVSGARIGTRSVVVVPDVVVPRVLVRQRKAAFANPPTGPNQSQHNVMAGVELALAEAEAMLGGVKLIA